MAKIENFENKPQEYILGAVLMKETLLRSVKMILTPEDFTDDYKEVYKAMLKLEAERASIDILTVTSKVVPKVSPFFVSTLTNGIGSPDLVEGKPITSWCLLVKEGSMRTELGKVLIEANKNVGSFDIFKIIETLRTKINKLTPVIDHGIRDIDSGIKILDERINRNLEGIKPMISGISAVDDFTLGYQKGDLVIVSGETSQGKTAFALSTMFNSCMMGKRIALYSYEMTTAQMMARIVAIDSGVSAKKILMMKLTDDEIKLVNKSYGRLEGAGFYFVEPRKKTLDWLESSIENVINNYGIDMVIVDYLQLISGPGSSRNEQIGGIANSLKHFATRSEIDVPIMLLSQLNRNAQNPQPQLWRLKESGDIENAADTVMGIWRPDHYNLGADQFRGVRNHNGSLSERDLSGKGIVEIMKGRNIGTARIAVDWNETQTLYSNLT